MSLAACAPTQPPEPRAAIAVDAPRASSAPKTRQARKVVIVQQLAPRCGTPTAWSINQADAAAAFIEKTAAEPGQQLEAAELERLNDAVKICRGEK